MIPPLGSRNRVTDGEIKIKKDIVSEVPELLTAN